MDDIRKLIRKYWIAILIILALLIGTYFWFIGQWGPTAGDGLSKKDWLAFWGSFLSFGGSVALGAIAVWQNKQANETNCRAIEENRRMSEIEFENELKRNKCLLILDGIHEISKRISEIIQRANLNRNGVPMLSTTSFIESIQVEINVLYEMEIDNFLPSCYERDFPELIKYKDTLKESLKIAEKQIEMSKMAAGINNAPELEIIIDKKTLLDLNSHFHEILNSVSTYSSFDGE